MTPVNKHIVQTILFHLDHWALNQQLICICRPLTNVIALSESADVTLADCILELTITCHAIKSMQPLDSDVTNFFSHAKQVVREQFHAMNMDIHWLCLFLHPLYCKLAISNAPHSRTLRDACTIATKLSIHWGYTELQSRKLIADIHVYSQGKAPFSGGKKDTKAWYMSLLISSEDHPLKGFALILFAIKLTAADTEDQIMSLLESSIVKVIAAWTLTMEDILSKPKGGCNQDAYESSMGRGKGRVIHVIPVHRSTSLSSLGVKCRH